MPAALVVLSYANLAHRDTNGREFLAAGECVAPRLIRRARGQWRGNTLQKHGPALTLGRMFGAGRERRLLREQRGPCAKADNPVSR